MKRLLEKYEKLGFKIICVPSNQFGKQEPWEVSRIKEWTESKFQLPQTENFQHTVKMDANGETSHAFFKWLKYTTGDPTNVKWNFCTAFLVSKLGKVSRHNNFRWNSLGKKIENLVKQRITETEV